MAKDTKLDAALRRLDEALRQLDGPAEQQAAPPEPDTARPRRRVVAGGRVGPRRRGPTPLFPAAAPPGALALRQDAPEPPRPEAAPLAHPAPAPPPLSEALARLIVGAALLGLDGLAARAPTWEHAAGLQRAPGTPNVAEAGAIDSPGFRHALIGWIFASEERLRPRGHPVRWLRTVVSFVFGAIFAVLIELLPLPGLRRSRHPVAPEPSAEDTRRWVSRGMAEEVRSRRFAAAALEEIVANTIIYLARRPAVAQALGEIVRSPAMEDAARTIVAGPVLDDAMRRVAASVTLDEVIDQVGQSPAITRTVRQIVQSPVIEDAVSHIVRTPAMEDAVKHLVSTPAMGEAIDTLAQSPALVALVTTQGSSLANEILSQVRERAVTVDSYAEMLARRLLRRRPRAELPLEARGIVIDISEHRLRRPGRRNEQ
jgi:hypothetical protein